MGNGRANRIAHDLCYLLSQKAKFGQSKHKAKQVARDEYLRTYGNLNGYNPSKAEGIYSLKTMAAYRQTANEFAKYAAEQGCKNGKSITRELASQYLQNRQVQGLSAWTVSKDMSALNKIFGYNFSKQELGLKSRHLNEITRSRGEKAHDYRNHERDKDAIVFAKGCGCRRTSVTTVTPKDLRCNESGIVVAIHLKEKGGKERVVPVLNKYKEAVTDAVNRHLSEPDKPIFNHYDSTIDNHAFRGEYAIALMKQLENEKENCIPLCGGDFDPRPLCNLRGKDKSNNPTYRGHDREICGMVSGAMGHNRLEVIFSHYRCGE